MGEGRIMQEQLSRVTPGAVTEEQLTPLNSATSRHAESCILRSFGYRAIYSYLQPLLLVLLFIKPKRVIILGLGGGGLIHALRHYDTGIR